MRLFIQYFRKDSELHLSEADCCWAIWSSEECALLPVLFSTVVYIFLLLAQKLKKVVI